MEIRLPGLPELGYLRAEEIPEEGLGLLWDSNRSKTEAERDSSGLFRFGFVQTPRLRSAAFTGYGLTFNSLGDSSVAYILEVTYGPVYGPVSDRMTGLEGPAFEYHIRPGRLGGSLLDLIFDPYRSVLIRIDPYHSVLFRI